MHKSVLNLAPMIVAFVSLAFLLSEAVISDFGAVSDGKTLNTTSIQKAIDTCHARGGGTVLVTGGGAYMSGTLYLKSHVTLRIENGTTLLGSPRYSDYATDTHKNMYKNEPHMDRCFLFAKDAESISIEGDGIIDGNGHVKNFKGQEGRPMLIRFLNCRNIRMRDVSSRLLQKGKQRWTTKPCLVLMEKDQQTEQPEILAIASGSNAESLV